ncbi:MAG: glycoside hydrolase family 15 protein [Bacillota bacterium]
MQDYLDPLMPGGITGNGRMLCSIRQNGMLHRLFWPHIDWGQHMGIFMVGIQEPGGNTHWLDSDEFMHTQSYPGNSSILETVIKTPGEDLEISQTDLVMPDNDILVRVYRIANRGPAVRSLNLIAYCSFSIEESSHQDGMSYLPASQALVQFRRDVYLGLKCPDRTPYGFHCGRRNAPSDPFAGISRGEFWGNSDNIMSGAGALGWSIGLINPGEEKTLTLVLAAAHSEDDLLELLGLPALLNPEELIKKTRRHWEDWLEQGNSANGRTENTPLYRRSLLSMKLMSDSSSGASVAAPEFDSHYAASGGYGYCWPRDGMFVALALDETGFHDEAELFYKFAARTQNRDGSWHQRYFMNGCPAPTWGQQIDQAGAVLWGYHHHYSITGDAEFLVAVWPSVLSGADYLARNISSNGLPAPSMELWEDDFSQSSYSSAAVYGGLKASALMADALDKTPLKEKWNQHADAVRESIIANLWRDDIKTFIKSVNRRVYEWDYCRAMENGQDAKQLQVPGTPYSYFAVPFDLRMDAALLGLCYPFGVFPPDDLRMLATVEAIEKKLQNGVVGGIHRYEGDSYAGGNPWVITTLWMSVFHSLRGNYNRAGELLRWSEKNCSPTGLLPEQVHRENGGPAWVLPLNWSHAMYVLASRALSGRLSRPY